MSAVFLALSLYCGATAFATPERTGSVVLDLPHVTGSMTTEAPRLESRFRATLASLEKWLAEREAQGQPFRGKLGIELGRVRESSVFLYLLFPVAGVTLDANITLPGGVRIGYRGRQSSMLYGESRAASLLEQDLPEFIEHALEEEAHLRSLSALARHLARFRRFLERQEALALEADDPLTAQDMARLRSKLPPDRPLSSILSPAAWKRDTYGELLRAKLNYAVVRRWHGLVPFEDKGSPPRFCETALLGFPLF